MLHLCSLVPESTAGASRHRLTPLLSAALLMLGVLVVLAWLDRVFTAGVIKQEQSRAFVGVCAHNQARLGAAMLTYAENHGGRLPPAQEWCDRLRPYLKLFAPPDADPFEAFVCPATRNQRCSYAFNANLSGVRLADIPKSRRVVILFESDRGWNAAGGPELLPAQPRHSLERDVALRGVRQTLAASGWSRDRLVETDHWLPQARAAKASR